MILILRPSAKYRLYSLLFSATWQLIPGTAMANKLVAWGNPTNVPAGSVNPLTISAGRDYTLAVSSDGSLVDWGNDLGVPPPGLSNLKSVAAGYSHSLALKRDGTIAVWGDPTWAGLWTAVPDGLTNVVAISANGDSDGEQSLALKADGTVVAWGNVSSVPDGLSNVVAIAAGGWHALALKNDGTVVAWGHDDYGQTDIPAGLSNVVAIAAGDWHSVALKRDGTVVAWSGVDWKGEVSGAVGLSNIVAIAAGAYRTVALRNDGTMFACGSITPPPADFTNVVAISTGTGHTVAVIAPLQITSITRTNQNSQLRFHTFSGQQYSVEYSPSLNPGSWTNLPGSNISGDGGDALVTDTNVTASIKARFYRLKQ